MGNSLFHDKIEGVKATMNEKVEAFKAFQMGQGDAMRSAQMATQIAIARDQLQWGAGLCSFILFGAAAYTHKTKSFPKPLIPPLVIISFVLAYQYDFAYGTKLIRVRKEAEHILDHEREYLIPPKTMPSRKLWEKEAAIVPPGGPVKRVGEHWPFYSHFNK